MLLNLNYFSHSLSRKLLLAFLAISAIVTTVATLVQLYVDYEQDINSIKNNIEVVDKSYKKTITNSVWDFNKRQLQVQLDGVRSLSGIQYVIVKDLTKTIGQAGLMPEGDFLTQTYDLIYNNGGKKILVGKMSVYAGTDQVWDRIYKKVLFLFLLQFFKSLIVTALFYMVIQLLVVRHLSDMGKYFKNFDLQSLQYDFKLKRSLTFLNHAQKKDELDALTDAINQMRHFLKKSYSDMNEINSNLEKIVADKTTLIIQQRQKMEFASKMTSLGEMAGGIAHEINTPLAALSLNTELLIEKIEKSGSDKNYILNSLQKNIKIIFRIGKTVQALKTFSRNGGTDEYTNASINSIIEETVALCQEKINSNQITLKLPQLASDIEISCREVEISQVLLNLISNAHDAILPHEKKWIQIDFHENEMQVSISVTDSGLGIPEDVRKKMFQPFYSTKEVGKGTGLGLSISKGIMESHGGELYIDDKSPNTRFVMIIPKTATALVKIC